MIDEDARCSSPQAQALRPKELYKRCQVCVKMGRGLVCCSAWLMASACVGPVVAFTPPVTWRTAERQSPLVCAARPGSYEVQLAEARAKRAIDKGNGPTVPSPALKGDMPEAMAGAVTAAQKLPTGSSSPLSPEIQGHVATLLSLLGQRMNSETPLSPDQLQQFADAAAEVLADAKSPPQQEELQVAMYKGGQPVFFMGNHETKPSTEQAPSAAQQTSTTADAVSSYMRSSTYYVEGMENMTPEQYRSTLNAKIANAMTERRMRGGSYGNEAAWDYMQSLNQNKHQ